MGKRGNDNAQISKEDFDRIQDTGGSEIKFGMSKANDATLKTRRIVNVSRRGAWAKSKPSVVAPPQQQKPSNPFNNIALTASVQPNEVPEPQKNSNTNPFATISLVQPSAKLAFSQTASSTSSSTGAPTMGFGGNKTENGVQLPTQKFPAVSNTKFTRRIDKLNYNFFSFLVEDAKNNTLDNWVSQMNSYIKYAKDIQKKEMLSDEKKKTSTISAPVQNANIFQSASSATAPTITFGLSLSQQPPATSTPTVTSGFNFTIKTNPAPGTTPAATHNQDEDSFPKESPEEALSESNPDETCVYEVKAKHYKLQKDQWKDHGVGKLRIYQHKTLAQKRRLVMRNTVGKVQLNIALGSGMKFSKIVRKKNSAVRFLAILEQGKDPLYIMLVVTHDNIDDLLGQLEMMAH